MRPLFALGGTVKSRGGAGDLFLPQRAAGTLAPMNHPSRSLTKLPLIPPLATNRCGDCDICCDIIGASELGKPYYARCAHMNKGCTIYETRPKTCRVFRCAWHMGFFGDKPDYRPDRLGLILHLTGTSVEAYETRPGALAENQQRLPHLVARIKSHRTLQDVQWDAVSTVYYPYGADISINYPVGPAFAPYQSPAGEIPVKLNPRGVAEFAGNVRNLLLPAAPPTGRSAEPPVTSPPPSDTTSPETAQ
jgi:hypothetical protein